MSVSGELLCSFELLKPLDSSALKSHIKKGRNKRNSILNSPVSFFLFPLGKPTQLSTTFADDGFLLGIYSLQPCRHKASKNPTQAKTLIIHRWKIKKSSWDLVLLFSVSYRIVAHTIYYFYGGRRQNKGFLYVLILLTLCGL